MGTIAVQVAIVICDNQKIILYFLGNYFKYIILGF